MKVLCDFHHGDLLESLRLLFENRLGWELYRPIGLEWFREGYWNVWHAEDTARQYLGLELTAEWEKLRDVWLNRDHSYIANGIYSIPDPHYPAVAYRAITLPAAKETKWDIVLSTMPQHYGPYENFRQRFSPQAKHIFQAGNMWPIPDGCRNILNSTSMPTPQVPNWVRYHQEFDTNLFKPGPCENPRSIANLMHYQVHHHLPQWHMLKGILPGWTLNNYGAGNELGSVQAGHMPDTIRRHGFIFHMKKGGEGYGYNIHHAFASGRPMIIRGSLYREMISEPLFVNGMTCLDLDQYPLEMVPDVLNNMANDWEEMSQNVYARFTDIVNFDAEFEKIQAFLGKLQ